MPFTLMYMKKRWLGGRWGGQAHGTLEYDRQDGRVRQRAAGTALRAGVCDRGNNNGGPQHTSVAEGARTRTCESWVRMQLRRGAPDPELCPAAARHD
jgi:hypothetical protein